MTGHVPVREAGLFGRWFVEEIATPHRSTDILIYLVERSNGRESVWSELLRTVRSHYLSDETLENYCNILGYQDAARALRERMPRDKTARSGELGEVLATEYVNECLPTQIPIKRLRYKDERETALRGDDLVGMYLEGGGLHVLKGESKSRISLTTDVLLEAEEKLLQNGGHPSQHSASFIADHLLASDRELATAVLQLVLRNIEPRTLKHLIFALTQCQPRRVLPRFSARSYPAEIQRLFVAASIKEHKQTIRDLYEAAAARAAFEGDQADQ